MIPERLAELLDGARGRPLAVLTGAGISAESGIPTFRGEEGYWRVGSQNYRPEQLATQAAFRQIPEELWAWYLYRRGVCMAAEPNAAHRALVELEDQIGDRFALITQNVDGLHQRAGNTAARTFAIHGHVELMRCGSECTGALAWSIPDSIPIVWPKERRLAPAEIAALRCPRCGAMGRPHVLWFDETYDEPRYRKDSALAAGDRGELLLIVGTSGATTLPLMIADRAARRGRTLIVVNKDPSPFSELADALPRGFHWEALAAEAIPAIAARLRD